LLINQELISLQPHFGGIVLFIKSKIVDTLSYKTVSANKETADKKWFIVDAEGQTVGRMASKVAKVIRGKHKPNFTPHADCGDNVIIINAEKVSFSGTKLVNKKYVRHTGYPGGQRQTSAEQMLSKHPERLIEKAIKGMLPKNTLGRRLFTNLKVYKGSEHNQEAQKPVVLNLDTFK
jgi:large subunit ribosomal protein L13